MKGKGRLSKTNAHTVVSIGQHRPEVRGLARTSIADISVATHKPNPWVSSNQMNKETVNILLRR